MGRHINGCDLLRGRAGKCVTVFFLNVFPFRTRQFTSRKLIIYTNTDVPTDTQSDVHSGPFIIENTGSILNVPQQEAG